MSFGIDRLNLRARQGIRGTVSMRIATKGRGECTHSRSKEGQGPGSNEAFAVVRIRTLLSDIVYRRIYKKWLGEGESSKAESRDNSR